MSGRRGLVTSLVFVMQSSITFDEYFWIDKDMTF